MAAHLYQSISVYLEAVAQAEREELELAAKALITPNPDIHFIDASSPTAPEGGWLPASIPPTMPSTVVTEPLATKAEDSAADSKTEPNNTVEIAFYPI